SSSTISRRGRLSAIDHTRGGDFDEGKNDGEAGSAAGRGLDGEAAADLADVLAAFEQANAHPLRLRRYEGAEQAFAHELRAHAPAGVDDRDTGRRIVVAIGHGHPRARHAGAGFDRVLDEMADDAFEPGPIGMDEGRAD